MITATKRPPRMRGQRSGVNRLEKYSTNTITIAPITGPSSVPVPPMITMHIGRKDVPTAMCTGEMSLLK
jgi:hypothetical protein